MSWTEEKVNKLKDLWGKGQTASQIAEIIGGVSRNAVIGKAHRLNLSAKIKTRSSINHNNIGKISDSSNSLKKGSRKHRFRSLLLDKNFEPAKNLKDELKKNCQYVINDFWHSKHLNKIPKKHKKLKEPNEIKPLQTEPPQKSIQPNTSYNKNQEKHKEVFNK